MRELLLFLMGFISVSTIAQNNTITDRSLLNQLEKLANGKKILYVSFLPGDENTRLLITASQKYHYNTGVFWMSRGEGMTNFNGREKGVDLGVIHVAEMEQAARLAGYQSFVSSCIDIGARDTAAIKATFPLNRLVLDMAAVIRQYRPDVLIIGHMPMDDSSNADAGFNAWMDFISEKATQLAAANTQLENKSLAPFPVGLVLADIAVREAGSLSTPIALNGVDSLQAISYKQMAMDSKLALRSVYPNLDSIPLRKDTTWLRIVNKSRTNVHYKDAISLLFSERNDPYANGVWRRLEASGLDLKSIKDELNMLYADLMGNKHSAAVVTLGKIMALFLAHKKDQNQSDHQDVRWISDQLHSMQQIAIGLNLRASADQELGVLGQDFRLRVTRQQNPLINTAFTVVWMKVPGLTDTIILVQNSNYNSLLLDTSLHIPLFGGAYQPFWLNKAMRSDGSYNIDTQMQGCLSDTTSFRVIASLRFGMDSLTCSFPVYYRHFDRLQGQVRQPFYTIEPLLVSLTPTVLLTQVLRDQYPIHQKELHINIKTLFKDTAQIVLFKIRQVGLSAIVNGQKIQSDTASMVYQDAGYMTPSPGKKMEVGIVLTQGMIKHFNPLTPILKPAVLLKLPEGVQRFSANIKSIGYPYQSPRLYNYHSQTIVVSDTIYTSGKRLLYLNGISGDVFENAFNQLGYEVTSSGYDDFSNLAAEIDLQSNSAPSFLIDSLAKLDAIVISGGRQALFMDSIQLNRLSYLLNSYVKAGGRLINLSHDQVMSQILPTADSVITDRLYTASDLVEGLQVDSSAAVLNRPNKVPASYFKRWEGLFARAAVLAQSDSTLYPLNFQKVKAADRSWSPVAIDLLGKGAQINCFIELGASLSNGNANAYKFLANLLAGAPKKEIK